MKKLFCFTFILFYFASCGDVQLNRAPEKSNSFSSQIPDGSFCSRIADQTSGTLKVLFVIDMSLSNIGEFKEISPGKVKFDASKATDANGIRFQKIKDFLQNCGSKNEKNKFKIVGFSGGALKANPTASGCVGGFENKNQALSSVESLKGLQDYNKKNIAYNDFSPSMQTTSYQDGLECAKNIVVDDIKKSPVEAKNSDYLVFFVTDGQASDNCPDNSVSGTFRDQYGACCEGGSIRVEGQCCAKGVIASSLIPIYGVFTKEFCCQPGDRRSETNKCEIDPDYASKISGANNPRYEALAKDIMLAGKQKASSIKIQTLFYGDEKEQAAALGLLNHLAEWGDTEKTISIQNVNQVDFCQYANSPIQTEYQTSEFNVINLTVMMKGGILKADSDMDGLVDSEDPSPDIARSNAAGILDGICKLNSGSLNCKKPVSCSSEHRTGLILDECDLAALSVSGGDGLDSDKDRIPDVVEILRSTLPNVNDSFNNLDGDSLSNIEEIRLGRQVDSPDDDVSEKYLTRWSIAKMPNDDQCPLNQKQYSLVLKQIPTLHTLKYKDLQKNKLGSLFDFSHEEDENVVLIYFFSEPLNNSSLPSELYATLIKIPFGKTDLSHLKLSPKSFIKVGNIDGKPRW